MNLQSTRHAAVLDELVNLLVPPLKERARVRVRGPFAASDDELPAPDLAIIFPGKHWTEHPASAFLIVDVVEGAQQTERDPKRALYASAGVIEYWVVDIASGIVLSHRSPSDGQYRNMWRFERGDIIALAAFPDVILRVSDFLP